MTDREADRTVENDRLYAVLPETETDGSLLDHGGLDGFVPATGLAQSTADAEPLDCEAVIDLLRRTGALEEVTA
jgi:hypothetical protein